MKFKAVLVLSILIPVTNIIAIKDTMAGIKPEDAIKFRQSGMMFMRWNMGKIKQQVVTNPQSYNKEKVLAAANVIAAIANSGMGALYSHNNRTGKGWKDTRVKPEYFKQPDEVKKRASAFKQQANELAKVAGSGNATQIKTQFNRNYPPHTGEKYLKKVKKVLDRFLEAKKHFS